VLWYRRRHKQTDGHTVFRRVQVGQVAVVKFGDEPALIQPFQAPYSADAGADMLGRYRTRFRVLCMAQSTVHGDFQSTMSLFAMPEWQEIYDIDSMWGVCMCMM
jgi:midasin (ATPase involved in ribosome maturation)